MLFTAPKPLLVGRMIFELDAGNGLSKTVKNFSALCTGEKGMCKNARNKKLHYLGCPIHRVVEGFAAQGGDITRGDGSGGEVRLRLGEKIWLRRRTRLPFANIVDLRRKIQRRQGWIEDQVQKGILGDGKFWQEHQLIAVLRHSHG
jgi:hypothetical protein